MEDREKLISFISYLFGWISGLIVYLTEKKSSYIRFNAMQSIIFSGIFTGVGIIFRLLFFIPFLGKLFLFFYYLLYLAYFVIWIILLVKSFQGEYFKLPVIGDYAEKYSKV